jgi:hypothetical protein
LGFVFCFSFQLSTINSQDCGEKPVLDSLLWWDVIGISSQQCMQQGVQLTIITIEWRLYLALIWTIIINKILPHFISEVEECIFCCSACLPNIQLWNVWFVEMLDEW